MGIFRRTVFFIVVALLSINSVIYSEDKEIQFENLSIWEGLSSDSVSSIVQDRNGFLWFATKNGLNRYDGYNFKVIQHNTADTNSLSVNMIQCLYLDDANNLWIGTNGGGLDRYDISSQHFTNFHNNPDDPASLSNNLVISICKDTMGTMWAGTSNGLNKIDLESGRVERYFHNENDPAGLPGNVIRSLYMDSSGTLWIGTYKGLSKYNREQNNFTSYFYEKDNPDSLCANAVMSILGEKDGTLWLGTWGLDDEPGGLTHFDPEKGRFKRYPVDKTDPFGLGDERIYCMYRDSEDQIWIGTWGGGIYKFNKESETFYSYRKERSNLLSLAEDIIYSIYEDSSGIMWIGTNGGGINKYNKRKEQFSRIKHQQDNPFSLPINNILSILEDADGNMWYGSNNGGLVKYDTVNRMYKHYLHNPVKPGTLSNNVVQSLVEDRDGTLYIGTNHGLNILPKGSSTFEVIKHDEDNKNSISHNIVHRLYLDSKGFLWIGYYYSGLSRFNPADRTFEHFHVDSPEDRNISDNNVMAILEDNRGIIWVGTNNGLNKYENGHFKKYFSHDGDDTTLTAGSIVSIYQDTKLNLWIGTDKGLNKYNYEAGTFTRMNQAGNFKGRSITAIFEDNQGHLWFSTKKGVIKYSPLRLSFNFLTIDDGLLDNEILTGYKTKSGKMYFGSSKGLTTFIPSDVTESLYKPPILITAFKKFNKEAAFPKQIWEMDEIKISWKDNFITFDFASLDYSAPMKNRYAFKLEGFDKDWIYAGTQHSATYTNLDGGKYRFRVKATNSDGKWFDTNTGITVRVSSKPWKSRPAHLLYACLIVTLIIFLIIHFKRRLKKEAIEKRRLEKKVNERTRELKIMNDTLLARNKEIDFNLSYAGTLQSSILPADREIKKVFEDFFIYWNPKGEVGGDFYWFQKTPKNHYLLALADCTGHGIPGALMTMTVNAELNHITKDICNDNPALILQNLNSLTRIALKQENRGAPLDEGLDIALLYYIPEEKKIIFSGARMALYYCENGEVFKIKGNKQSIGYFHSKEDYKYENHEIKTTGVQAFYLTSDGLTTQLGGSKGLPLGNKQFKKYITEHHKKPFEKQKTELEKFLKEYRGTEYEQIDDITVIGFKF